MRNEIIKYYMCAGCGFVDEISTPEEEMNEEYKKNFPDDLEMKEPRAMICDDCYDKLYGETEGFTK